MSAHSIAACSRSRSRTTPSIPATSDRHMLMRLMASSFACSWSTPRSHVPDPEGVHASLCVISPAATIAQISASLRESRPPLLVVAVVEVVVALVVAAVVDVVVALVVADVVADELVDDVAPLGL